MRIDVNDEKRLILFYLGNWEVDEISEDELSSIYDMYYASHPGYTIASVFSGKKPLVDQISSLLLRNKNIEQTSRNKADDKANCR